MLSYYKIKYNVKRKTTSSTFRFNFEITYFTALSIKGSSSINNISGHLQYSMFLLDIILTAESSWYGIEIIEHFGKYANEDFTGYTDRFYLDALLYIYWVIDLIF